MKHASGLIFLFMLGILSVIIAMAFAMLMTARSAHAGQRSIQAGELAQLAAQEGTDHAIGIIRRQFDNGKAIPTQLTDSWRSHFLPIDAMKVKYDLSMWSQPYGEALGLAGSPEDLYENDVHIENRLWEPYAKVDAPTSTYNNRTGAYLNGYFWHHGNARWYEPGVQTSDPVARPLSFHLPHPLGAVAGSPDPAARAGENHTPDLDQPLWYDKAFVATTDASKRRYRLRYAVAVEDLGGHLLVSAPKEYDPAAISVLTLPPLPPPAPQPTPSIADQSGAFEVDKALADRYAGALSNLARYTHPSVVGNTQEFMELAFRGLGTPAVAQPNSDGGTGLSGGRAKTILAGMNPAGSLLRWQDYINFGDPGEPNKLVNAQKPSSGTFAYFALGPLPSFQRMWWHQQNTSGNDCWLPLLFTPFGRIPVPVAAPTAWDQGYVDNPWRINLPTAAPRVLAQMVTAYMPAEFTARKYGLKKKSSWTGSTWNDAAVPDETLVTPIYRETGHVRLFQEMAAEAYFAKHGGIAGASYPGTKLDVPDGWEVDLGVDVKTDNLMLASNMPAMSQVGTKAIYPITPLATYDDTMLQQVQSVGFSEIAPLAGMVELQSSSAGYVTSYWNDLYIAMLQALALAQWSWNDKVLGASALTSGSGRPVWPAGIPAAYFPAADAPGFAPNTAARDRDVDGDGVKDVPSTFDTVREIDQQFLRNLGEDPALYPTGGRPVAAVAGLRIRHDVSQAPPTVEVVDLAGAGSKTIKAIRNAGKPTQAALMELVVNDMRMSFFGASPGYSGFQPLDLDDDGTVRCSCYVDGSVSAASVPTAAMKRFSLTGYIDFQKSRYYRIMVRGEVFDEMRGTAIAQDNVETVYVVDPDGDVVNRQFVYTPIANRTTGMSDSHVLFQRRHRNRYLGLTSRLER